MTRVRNHEKGKITDLLEGVLGDIYAIEKQPAPRDIDNLDRCVAACAEALTRIKRLRRWVRMELENGVPLKGCPTDGAQQDDWEATRDQEDYLSSHLIPEGCPTDEEIQIAGWSEGRGYD